MAAKRPSSGGRGAARPNPDAPRTCAAAAAWAAAGQIHLKHTAAYISLDSGYRRRESASSAQHRQKAKRIYNTSSVRRDTATPSPPRNM
ncbi:hypothetical protein EYF80_062961 [Liparis tanakae]|uniref:Uncharacterized protein n=1 Tax=Liparis tanakae TaxID=230148 RepID=A0A4Z2EDA6_9TELE|nr:hypothetical protein EYF80_062961 [Liparis tanakae]